MKGNSILKAAGGAIGTRPEDDIADRAQGKFDFVGRNNKIQWNWWQAHRHGCRNRRQRWVLAVEYIGLSESPIGRAARHRTTGNFGEVAATSLQAIFEPLPATGESKKNMRGVADQAPSRT